jgi:hypothetical protein
LKATSFCHTIALPGVLLVSFAAAGALAQTRLELSTIVPGSENVQLVQNGDFQFQGPTVNSEHPFPIGWIRFGDMFAGPGLNMTAANGAVVARGHVDGGAPVSLYHRTINLEPNTEYVLSGYLWNMGDDANHVTTVIDMNDVSGEPQITLDHSDSNADQGYFVYRSFHTADTGFSITFRAFYDGRAGTGTSPAHSPVGAQWDNLAITKASDFIPPQASGTNPNLRPRVSILSPADGTNISFQLSPAVQQISVSASDPDGSITKVEFFANGQKVGNLLSSPFNLGWSNFSSGPYQLTAVATDNSGATTVSAPVNVILTVPVTRPTLAVRGSGQTLQISWPTSAIAFTLQSTTGLAATSNWRTVTNTVVTSNAQESVTVTNSPAQRFFRLGMVDRSTLNRKLMMGYQGWFACPQDGSPPNSWVHWFRSQTPVAADATFDFWPDTSELDPDELFATSMTMSNGSPAKLYSAFNQKTVVRHFKWMKDNHLDGVFLQRFSSELSDPSFFALRNQVAANVRAGAEKYGRMFAIMYDISGQPASTLLSTLTNDWAYLVNTMKITQSSRYVFHKGKPVVAIWGFGFTDRPGTPQDAQFIINYFKTNGVTLMGGVPTYWRTLNNDSQNNPSWASVYRSFDIISPWAVGRYKTLAEADNFKQNLIVPDLAEATAHGREYMPVIFPGFSWHNLTGGPLNDFPRNGGTFYWRQAYNAVSAGCSMIYGAMFDEVDEGTAMFKMAPTPNELPVQGTFVPLNIDGQNLPNDWYLRLANEAGKMLRGEIPLRSQMPITP